MDHRAIREALEALRHGVSQLNGIGIPMEADPLHTAIAAQTAEGGEVCNVKSSAGLIRPGKVDAWVANHYTNPPASQGQAHPIGWVACRIEHEPGYPEDVAYGPPRMMDRLKKWLDKHFANTSPQLPEGVIAILDECRTALMECDRDCDYELIERIDAIDAARK